MAFFKLFHLAEILWSSFFYLSSQLSFVVRLWELSCCCCLLLYAHLLLYCFLQIQPFAAQLLDNTLGAPGIPSVRVRPGRSGLEQNLSELVIHTTTVLQTINHVTICEPLRLLMDNPAALMVQFCFRLSFLFFCPWRTVPTDCKHAKYELKVNWM